MKAYANYEDYKTYGITPTMSEAEASETLLLASYNVNSVCMNRIEILGGVGVLPPNSYEAVKTATLLQANFLFENKEAMKSNVKSYSIGGASITYQVPLGGVQYGEITLDAQVLSILRSCGLLCQNMGWKRGLM